MHPLCPIADKAPSSPPSGVVSAPARKGTQTSSLRRAPRGEDDEGRNASRGAKCNTPFDTQCTDPTPILAPFSLIFRSFSSTYLALPSFSIVSLLSNSRLPRLHAPPSPSNSPSSLIAHLTFIPAHPHPYYLLPRLSSHS